MAGTHTRTKEVRRPAGYAPRWPRWKRLEAFEERIWGRNGRTRHPRRHEFGRTRDQWDHGHGPRHWHRRNTGLGGAVKGGRVIADWPGLKDVQLDQNRDLSRERTCAQSTESDCWLDLYGVSGAALATGCSRLGFGKNDARSVRSEPETGEQYSTT